MEERVAIWLVVAPFVMSYDLFFFFSSRRRHTRWTGDWSSDVCSSDLSVAERSFVALGPEPPGPAVERDERPLRHAAVHDLDVVGLVGPPQELDAGAVRSEERRVGKEGRSRGEAGH